MSLRSKKEFTELNARKQKRITSGKGYPAKREGRSGDIRIRQIDGKGLHLFVKYGQKWYSIPLEEKVEAKYDRDRITIKPRNPKLSKYSTEMFKAGDDVIVQVDSGSLKVRNNINEGNPTLQVGSSDDEVFKIEVTYDSTAKTLDYVTFNTRAASSSANKGKYLIKADNVLALTLDDNALHVEDREFAIDATKTLYFDGDGGDTWITQVSHDKLQFTVGATAMLELDEAGTSGDIANFKTTGAGFTQGLTSYHVDDTNVQFNLKGNKAFLTFGSGNITDLHLFFPNVSCNCILLVKQDATGSRLITNYKTWDQASGNASTVIWAGGSNPTLTTTGNKIDIMSFYWDNTNHKAYGTITHNF